MLATTVSSRGRSVRASLLVGILAFISTAGVSKGITTCNKGPLALNGNGQGTLPPWGHGEPQPTDIWCFTPNTDGLATVTVTTAGMFVTAQFFDTDGTVLYPTTQASNPSITFTYGIGPGVGPPPTYYIEVKYWSGTAGDYQISDTFVPAAKQNDVEPNDTSGSAVSLALPDSKTGHLGFHDPQHHLPDTLDVIDWYKITPTSDGILSIDVTTDGMRVTAQLYDVDGSVLYPPSQASSAHISFSYGIGPGGGPPPTYYLQVKYWSLTAGSYTISETFNVATSANDPEPNDVLGIATVLPLGVSKTGHLGFHDPQHHVPSPLDAADWYKLSPNAGGSLSVNVATDGMLIHAQLYDSGGNLLYPIGQSPSSSISFTYTVSPVTYYIDVQYFNGTAGTYSLCAALNGAGCGAGNPTPTPTPTRTHTPTPTPTGPPRTGTPTPTPTAGSQPGPFTLSGQAYCNTAAPAAPGVKLSWSSSADAATYSMYRDDLPYVTGLTQASFTDNADVVAGQTYRYFVRAYNSKGSTDSNAVSVAVGGTVCAVQPPVIFVHGFCSDASTWDTMIANLRRLGSAKGRFSMSPVGLYFDGMQVRVRSSGQPLTADSRSDVYTISFYNKNHPTAPFDILATVALQIDDEADQLAQVVKKVVEISDSPTLDVVAHSMGGLVTRVCLEGLSDLATPAKIRRVVTVDTPHAGVEGAAWPRLEALLGGLLLPPFEFLKCVETNSEQKADMIPGGDFLEKLNGQPLPSANTFEMLTAIASSSPVSTGDQVVEFDSQNITSLKEYGCVQNAELLGNHFPFVVFPELHTEVLGQSATALRVFASLVGGVPHRVACQKLVSGVQALLPVLDLTKDFTYRVNLDFDLTGSDVAAQGVSQGACTADLIARSAENQELMRRTVATEDSQSLEIGPFQEEQWQLEVLATCDVELSITVDAVPPGPESRYLELSPPQLEKPIFLPPRD